MSNDALSDVGSWSTMLTASWLNLARGLAFFGAALRRQSALKSARHQTGFGFFAYGRTYIPNYICVVIANREANKITKK